MKHIKKVVTLFLAFAMVLAMSATAFAADGDVAIELKQEPAAFADSHTYNVYEIFTGDITEKTVGEGAAATTVKELSNVKYGKNFGDTGASVPKSVLDAVGEDARAYADRILPVGGGDGKVKGTPVAQLNSSNNFKAEGLKPGYYLIIDTVDGDLADGDAFSTYIVQVLGDVSINTKKDVTSSGKKIVSDDHPNTEDAGANPGVSADGTIDNVSVGDKVNFEITAKVPSHATDYDYYYFIINDTLSPGLTLDPASIVVKAKAATEGAQETTLSPENDYELYVADALDESNAYKTPDSDHTFEVALKAAKAHAGETIIVRYSATLNKDAVIGDAGNPNTQNVEYSNNPNKTYDGTQDKNNPGKPGSTLDTPLGETPDNTTKTYTSGIKLQKVDQDLNALNGASFTIEGDSINMVVKNVETFAPATGDGADYWKLTNGAYTNVAPQTEDRMIEAPAGSTDGYVVAEADFEGETITVGGVEYRVVKADETPTHILQKKNSELYDSTTQKYKKTTTETVEETTSHISQALPVNADGTLNFKGLGAGTYTIKETVVPDGYTKAQDVTVVIKFDNSQKKFTATVNGTAVTAETTTNLFPVEVKNVAGNVLPETGGIGTVIFYVLGTLLVVGCGIVLISKRRMLNK